jgi:hypothetical protein
MESNCPMNRELTPEDRFLIDWCRVAPASPSAASPARYDGMDWPRLLRRAESNRVGSILFRNLREAPNAPATPVEILAAFRSSYLRGVGVATRATAELAPVVGRFRAAGIQLVLLRGLSAGTALYGDTALRPFTDVDLLILRRDLLRARECMEAAGCEAADGTLGPAYFEKYHLHVSYCHRASGAVFELHWALDHRYVPFTIPYESIIASAREIDIGGVQVRVPCPEHDLLANAVHAAKHAYFLPFLDNDESLRRRVIDAGCLLHFCDIARAAASHGGELNWNRIMEEGRGWNVMRELSVVLRTTESLFPGWLPGEVTGRLERLAPSWIERAAFRALDHDATRNAKGGPKRPPGAAALRTRPMFRPVRVLDLLRYVNPGPQFLRHRYRCRSRATTLLFRVAHPLVAAAELAGNAVACLR